MCSYLLHFLSKSKMLRREKGLNVGVVGGESILQEDAQIQTRIGTGFKDRRLRGRTGQIVKS